MLEVLLYCINKLYSNWYALLTTSISVEKVGSMVTGGITGSMFQPTRYVCIKPACCNSDAASAAKKAPAFL
jgi:hypothetical protein